MRAYHGSTTNPALLLRVRKWRNSAAWREFFVRYDALLDAWCHAAGLDATSADEVRERIWEGLITLMQTFEYDPRKSFRGWLREVWRTRMIDYLRKMNRDAQKLRPLDDASLDRIAVARCQEMSDAGDSNDDEPMLIELRREAEAIQIAVKGRCQPSAWNAFCGIAIDDRPIREVAAENKLSYAAAYAACSRVRKMLREEAGRRSRIRLG